MATLPVAPPFTVTSYKQPKTTNHRLISLNQNQFFFHNPIHLQHHQQLQHNQNFTTACAAYKVTLEHEGQSTELEVDADETILSKAIDSGIENLPYDCKLGVCMTCPAKLISGAVDQSDGMLSDDVIERGFALLCASYPRSDCTIRTIPEEELLSMQLATAND